MMREGATARRRRSENLEAVKKIFSILNVFLQYNKHLPNHTLFTQIVLYSLSVISRITRRRLLQSSSPEEQDSSINIPVLKDAKTHKSINKHF